MTLVTETNRPNGDSVAGAPGQLRHRLRDTLVLLGCTTLITYALSPDARAQITPHAASPAPQFTSPGFIGEAPFTIENSLIIVSVQLGNSAASAATAPKLRFLLDTGAALTVVSQEALVENKLDLVDSGKGGVTINVLGTGDSAGVAASQLKDKIIAVGNVTIKDSLLVVPVGSYVRHFKIDGAIGSDVFGSLVTQIDYANRRVRFYKPTTFKAPDANGNFQSVPLKRGAADGLPKIQAGIMPFGFGATQATMKFDTGDSGSVTLYGPFVAEHKWRDELPYVIPAKTAGVGGRADAFRGRLRSVNIGSQILDQPPVTFSVAKLGALSETHADGQFGDALLRRFEVILDYTHSKLYLRPNEGAGARFTDERYRGFITYPPATPDGGYKIEIVDPGSAADRNGICAGDILYKIDGQNVGGMSFDDLRAAFNTTGAERTLEIGSAGRSDHRSVKILPITY